MRRSLTVWLMGFALCCARGYSQETQPAPTSNPSSQPATSSSASSSKSPVYEWLGRGLDRPIEIKDDGLERLKVSISNDREKLQSDATLKPE
jgi:hypothetical protein